MDSMQLQSKSNTTRIVFEGDGRPTLVVGGHPFGRHYVSSGGRVRWRCRRYNHQCKAVIMTFGQNLITTKLGHNH
ncbi:hypothetical protein JYU34_004355 [Plutella xylostella]|uniref:FLYWCH-type domain-containing protein n=1 Tax=Plutella xylostella TaxID=51655 RepID=A0ABQ7QXS2_PLUXY|nr:hypothetical protein JYU34_004355 [Plutella xylostella]